MDYLPNAEKRSRNVNSFLAFLLFLCVMLTPGRVWAQEKSVTLDVRNASVESVLKQIEKQTDLTFFYDQGIMDASPTITLRVSNVSVKAALDEIARQTGLSFNRDNNTITVGKGSKADISKREETIRGKVIDETGEPLIGVNVSLEALFCSEDYLLDPANYELGDRDYKLTVSRSQNPGFTHTLSFSSPIVKPSSLNVQLKKKLPSWVVQYDDPIGDGISDTLMSKTYGLAYLLKGAWAAYTLHNDTYATIRVKIN